MLSVTPFKPRGLCDPSNMGTFIRRAACGPVGQLASAELGFKPFACLTISSDEACEADDISLKSLLFIRVASLPRCNG